MTAVDTTIVVLALPEMQRSPDVALSAVIWVIISFLLVITLLATQVGRLGDMFGRVRMYEAWDEASIIVFRVVPTSSSSTIADPGRWKSSSGT